MLAWNSLLVLLNFYLLSLAVYFCQSSSICQSCCADKNKLTNKLIMSNSKKNSSSSSDLNSKRNHYIFNIDNQRTLEISSNFQNGNINLVKQIHQLYYIVEAVGDIQNVQSKKSWFYFKIKSVKGIKVRIIVQNVNIYQNIFEQNLHCKPFYREGLTGKWQQLTESFLTYRDELSMVIDHTFKNSEDIYICLTIPFTFSDNELYLRQIKDKVHANIDYCDEILATTPEGKPVHLLTITQKNSNKTNKSQSVSEYKKPVILVTSRVHPGQVSSSYCFQGMLQFLLSYNNLQAYILRRLFIFKMIPILNPDGVCGGNYRMDPQGFNLNRHYLEPSKEQHPAIFQILQLMKELALKQKIQFYFDLHSHSSIKQSFIYGNALDDIIQQTYSELFCKILQENYPRFRYGLSNFGQKQMKHKDRGESQTKQGCGRVVINKLCDVIQSYTVQSSIFPSSYQCFINKTLKSEQKNKDFIYQPAGGSSSYEYESVYSNNMAENIMILENKRLGKSIMVSILDMIKKNPYSRLSEEFNDVFYREASAKLLQKEDRFKLMDIKAYHKSKMIQSYVKTLFEDKIDREWNQTGVIHQINSVNWPKEFRKITVIEESTKELSKTNIKSIRVKTEGRDKTISQSQSKPKKSAKTAAQVKNIQNDLHRSISPKQQFPVSLFPQIKYSIELKSIKTKDVTQIRTATVKQLQLNINDNVSILEGDRVNKKMIIQYIQQEINKINPDKQMFKRSNASLNRLIANKILEKQKAKGRNSQLNEYQKIIIESRKRIVTECKESINGEDTTEAKALKDRLAMDNDQQLKGLQLRKADMVKKRFLATNKAIQILKGKDKTKIKLPDLNKLNLIVENVKKQRQLREAHIQNRISVDSSQNK